MRWLEYQPVSEMSDHSNGNAVKDSVDNLLQQGNKLTMMSDFSISFNLFGEYDNFVDWDAAEERESAKKREKRHKKLTPGELNQIQDEKNTQCSPSVLQRLKL